MKTVDYIVVGCGLASISFCEVLRANNKTFVVFDDNSQKSSIVAAGLYNPVILKRFSEVWKSQEQLNLALPVYENIESKLETKLDFKISILRRFSSIEEQNLWFTASDKSNLEPFLSAVIVQNSYTYVDAPFNFGEVLHAGRLDTEQLIMSYKAHLKRNNQLLQKHFDYDELSISPQQLSHGDITANQIVFAEGFGVKKNPFFKHIALNGTKGEVLTIKAPELRLDAAIKSSVFIIPIGNDEYKVGATYDWVDKTNTPSVEAREELITKLKTFITCDFEIIDHRAGIRPTTKDRRPLVGRHSQYNNLYVLNGLGTRGVMIGPYVARKLYDYIETGQELDREIDIKRFENL
ncbi:MAG: FAD-dependent oxidoreductase [Winogradskyella sp.]|uniref:NAD(P)/FAD-dependent oxidoreductase n=1 Tax=Winogradskyella sp. TaxID=1883156 RepID=UPI000F3BDAD2|nr:FAD-dependent oxidoreductase [Winogradskyella sp.]RNC85068.1 MAG: FAD-dependent oxidoreductase [Winogradskyella sp.]